MDGPTHKDAIVALLSSCFPCRSEPPALPPSPRLQALLTDPESDSDAMSLHSTYRPHTRRKKKSKGVLQLCGVNLFGKSSGQIRLEDDEIEPINRPRPSEDAPRPRYDSDAAPLPDSAIHSLGISRSNTSTSPTTPTQPGPTTEQPTRKAETPEEELARLRAEKAARKARRRDRRERKARAQLALEPTADFEGYPGSGSFRDDALPISPPSTTTSTPGIDELVSAPDDRFKLDDGDPEDGEADMGAAVYTRSSGRSALGSSSSSGTGTGTGTSRTSASGRRSSLGLGFNSNNALGLGIQRSPLSPLAQSHVPGSPRPAPSAAELVTPAFESVTEPGELVSATTTDSVPQPEESSADPFESITIPVTSVKAPKVPIEEAPSSEVAPPESTSTGKQPSTASPPIEPTPTPTSTEPTKLAPPTKLQIPHKVSLTNLPMSSPGAGPGPRTMENSPRLAQLPNLNNNNNNNNNSPKTTGFGFPSPGLSRGGGFPSPGLGKSSLGGGFPSPGLGLGLNGLSSTFSSTHSGVPSPRIGGGVGPGGGFPFGNGPPRKGSVTAGMGVALAHRGD